MTEQIKFTYKLNISTPKELKSLDTGEEFFKFDIIKPRLDIIKNSKVACVFILIEQIDYFEDGFCKTEFKEYNQFNINTL